VSKCEAKCDKDTMHLGLKNRERQRCHRKCGEKLPLCGQPTCKFVPRLKGEVFGYRAGSSVPRIRTVFQTEQLVGLDLDGKGSVVCRVPRLGLLTQAKDLADLSWDLYLLDARGCARKLGFYQGATKPSAIQQFKNGLRSFTVPDWSPVFRDRTVRTYVFDGSQYRGGPSKPL